MRKIIPTIAFAIGVSTAAIAQQPAPMTSGPADSGSSASRLAKDPLDRNKEIEPQRKREGEEG